MGSTIPPSFPLIFDPLMYLVTVDIYMAAVGISDCDSFYVGRTDVCTTGVVIKLYHEAGGDCLHGNEIYSTFGENSAQRIIGIEGGWIFDEWFKCMLERRDYPPLDFP